MNERAVFKSIRTIIIVLAVFSCAKGAFAQVVFSEIKYTGNEWVEVVNEGGAPVDISLWRFSEGGTNHKLKPVRGGTSVPSKGLAVIANDASVFLNEYANFSGILFDSSFSLLDAGETLELKDESGSVVDTVTYSGTKGSKNSAQKIGGVWREGSPSPGAQNSATLSLPTPSQASETPTPSGSSGAVALPQVSPAAGTERRVAVVGSPIVFESDVLDASHQVIPGARVSWSFGDGASAEGVSVSHTYHYRGDYTVVVDVSSSAYNGNARISVHAVEPLVSLRTTGDQSRSAVFVENRGGEELDLSGWQIRAAERTFMIPKNTFLSPGKTIAFASETTGLSAPPGVSAELLFPSGTVVPLVKGDTQTASISQAAPFAQKKEPVAPKVAARVQPTQQASTGVFTEAVKEPIVLDGQAGETERLWWWYVGAAFLGAIALFGVMLARSKVTPAESYEILEEKEEELW